MGGCQAHSLTVHHDPRACRFSRKLAPGPPRHPRLVGFARHLSTKRIATHLDGVPACSSCGVALVACLVPWRVAASCVLYSTVVLPPQRAAMSSMFVLVMVTMGPIATLGLTSRSFLFVPYGEAVSPSLAASGPTISCDGRVPGSTLELTHWTDNVTPRPLPHVQSGLLAAPVPPRGAPDSYRRLGTPRARCRPTGRPAAASWLEPAASNVRPGRSTPTRRPSARCASRAPARVASTPSSPRRRC